MDNLTQRMMMAGSGSFSFGEDFTEDPIVLRVEQPGSGFTNIILAFTRPFFIQVEWGDGLIQTYFSPAPVLGQSVTGIIFRGTGYMPAEHTITIRGTSPNFGIRRGVPGHPDSSRFDTAIKRCLSFGGCNSIEGAFAGCRSLIEVPENIPPLATSTKNLFSSCESFNQNINNWDVSNVTDMDRMFTRAISFNRSLNNWDVSNVVNMERMFHETDEFNGDISGWNVSNVTNMKSMFERARKFNRNINNWNVSNVVDMEDMFYFARVFNQPLNNWDVSNVTNMLGMFGGFCRFNQNINNWDVSNVVDMNGMFWMNLHYNQPLNNWNVSNVVDMRFMFGGNSAGLVSPPYTKPFNQPLNNWDVSNVVDMGVMFQEALSFNRDISNWNVSNVTNMDAMFRKAPLFNQNLSSWITGLTSHPDSFSEDANPTFSNNANNLKPFLKNGVTRITT